MSRFLAPARVAGICAAYMSGGVAMALLAVFLLCAFAAPYDQGWPLFLEVLRLGWQGLGG